MNSLFYFEILFVKNKLAGDVSFCFILFGNIPKYMLAVYYQCGLNGEIVILQIPQLPHTH